MEVGIGDGEQEGDKEKWRLKGRWTVTKDGWHERGKMDGLVDA